MPSNAEQPDENVSVCKVLRKLKSWVICLLHRIVFICIENIRTSFRVLQYVIRLRIRNILMNNIGKWNKKKWELILFLDSLEQIKHEKLKFISECLFFDFCVLLVSKLVVYRNDVVMTIVVQQYWTNVSPFK